MSILIVNNKQKRYSSFFISCCILIDKRRMKRIGCMLVCAIICIVQMNAQEPGAGLLFNQFQRGLIKYRNNSQREALLNYNTVEQEFLFLSDDNTIMAIGDPQNIDMIVIGHRSFVPIKEDMFYEMLKAGNTNFFVQWKSKFISQGKRGAYGGYSGSSAISSVTLTQGGSTGTGGIGLHEHLSSDEKFKADMECMYYVIVGDKYRNFNSLKGLVKIFKTHKDQIKAFSGQNSVDYSNPDDVRKLLEYVYGL